ncbi:MAG: Gfo/Idh/MocA family oxidoreductase [Oscillospiraceae bacterium]|nr:Gfo/Idh/MocA family oxidoreductase [Oscillospiraceae bacterium]
MNMLRWGIIGTGRISRLFAEALIKCEGSEPAAVASRTLAKAEAFADKYGFGKAYGSYAEMAKDKDIDIIYIGTPMSSHYGDAMLCLDNGKSVLCEKSVALNTKQCEELIDKAKAKGLFFMEAMWMKCRPVYLKAKRWIAEGRIGKIEYIQADFCNFYKYDENDRLFRADCGGGALLDAGVYPLTMITDILGVPCEVVSRAHLAHEVDMSNSILLRYEDAYASVDSGFEVQNRNNAVIVGEKGSILFGDWFFCSSEAALLDENREEVEKAVIPPEINGYEYEIRECERCMESGLTESPLVPHEGTLAVMRIMDECRRSWGLMYPGE